MALSFKPFKLIRVSVELMGNFHARVFNFVDGSRTFDQHEASERDIG